MKSVDNRKYQEEFSIFFARTQDFEKIPFYLNCKDLMTLT